MKLLQQTPDLGHGWVRYTFRPWPGSTALWLDLFSRQLGKSVAMELDKVDLPKVEGLDDVLYLPPVDDSQQEAWERLERQLVPVEAPLLAQCLPGSDCPLPGAVEIFDVLEAVATDALEVLDRVPPQAAVVWPLIGGYTDGAEKRDSGLRRLADAGARCVQGIAADLSPADRRRVVEVAGDHGFETLFHGPGPSERDFASAVDRFGMQAFLDRPLPKAPSRRVHNRRLAGVLASIGELWLRLGRTESSGQSFYRAARWVDREAHDLVVLAREGNLGVVTWLDDDSREVILELATQEDSSLLQDLRRQYLEPGASR